MTRRDEVDEVDEKELTLLEKLVDKAIETSPSGMKVVAEARKDHPRASPAELQRVLEKRYLKRVARLGGAVGAVAAVPAVGTGAAVLLTTAQTGVFLRDSVALVMAVADLHGVNVTDDERRRTLVLAALLGEEGARAVSGQLGLGTLYWGRAAITRMPLGLVKAVNRTLTRRLVRAGLTRGGALALGRLAPFGIGVVIGYQGTKAIGKNVVEGVRDAFGPAPASRS